MWRALAATTSIGKWGDVGGVVRFIGVPRYLVMLSAQMARLPLAQIGVGWTHSVVELVGVWWLQLVPRLTDIELATENLHGWPSHCSIG